MKKILMIVLSLCLFAGCTQKKEEQTRYSGSFSNVFNTMFQVMMYEESQADFDENYEFIYQQFNYYNQLFDKYNTYDGMNNLKTINDQAGIAPVKVEKELFDLIQMSIDYHYSISDKVNVALGPVLEIWHNYRELNDGSLPTDDELQAANQYVDITKVILDEENLTVYLEDPNMSIDVGATAKGFACELVKDQLIDKGLDDFLISAGGNVISHGKRATMNKESSLSQVLPACREYYTISITSPKTGAYEGVGDDEIMAITLQNGESVVTSGDYERYFIGHDGKSYHHLIDPKTLYPANECRSVTVITEDSGLADYLSSTLFLLSVEDGIEVISKLDSNVQVVWLMYDGTMQYTNGLVEGENCHAYGQTN